MLARRVGVAILAAGAGVAMITRCPASERLPLAPGRRRPGWIGVAFMLEIASTLSFVLAFHGAYDRPIHPRASTGIALAMQGMNILLPAGGSGGLAAGAVMMDRAGVPRGFTASRTVALFLVTSLVSFAAIVAAGLAVATRLLDGDRHAATLVPALGALLVIAAVIALPRVCPGPPADPAARVASAARWSRPPRTPTTASMPARPCCAARTSSSSGARSATSPSTSRRWPPRSTRSAPTASRSASSCSPTRSATAARSSRCPGSSEGGLVAAFVLYGAALAPAAAAVLAYRTLHAGVPTLLGVIGLADARRQISRGRVLR